MGSPSPELYCPSCGQSYVAGDAAGDEVCARDGTRLVRLASADDPHPGREIDGRFTLLERIGAGGMGAVYRARQHSLGRDVAVKLIRSDHAQSGVGTKRFLREAQLVSRLSHPHVVGVLDFGQTPDGLLFLVMELIPGQTLKELAARGPLPEARAVEIAIQLADALDAAHQLSIVHRDLKPGNVMVLDGALSRDFVKVLDFGLAKSLEGDDPSMTDGGAVLGTPLYLSPEVALGQPATAASDLYALGIILYELVTGRRPFAATSKSSLQYMHALHPPTPLTADVSPELARLIMRLLEKDPGARHPSAGALRAALMEVRAEASVPDGAPLESAAIGSPPIEAPRGRRAWVATGVLLAALAGGVLAWRASEAAIAPETETSASRAQAPSGAPTPTLPAPSATPSIAAATASAATPPHSPASAAVVRLTLRARPDAEVLGVGDQRVHTPAELVVPRSSTPLTLTFRRGGHRAVERTVVPDRAQQVEVRLEPLPHARPTAEATPAAEPLPF